MHGDGSSTRDFIYVDDVVEGLLRCATTDGIAGDVFNLASGAEITILEGYLPRQLTDAELAELVQESVAASGAKGPRDMGAVMKALMPKIAGRAEGKRVSDAVKNALSKLGA